MSRLISQTIGLALLLSVFMSGARGADFEANTQPPPGPPSSTEGSTVPLSHPALEVLRLAESGVGESVIIAYINSSSVSFALTADDIVYLKDLGIEASIISAMLDHDGARRENPPQPNVADALTAAPGAETPAAAAEAPVYATDAPPDVAYFHSALVPYGSWIVLDDLGWCWRPHIMTFNPAWRPYWQGGRWIYSDWGWYWQSDYSWGWAVFHHGRWHHHHRHGWTWFPDRVWGPAWVSWRYSDTHCGWAPLPLGAHFGIGGGFLFNNVTVGVDFDFGLQPDHYSFVEIGRFHEHELHRHGIPGPRHLDVYHQTAVHNNYNTDTHHRIINHGIAPDRVADASHRPIRPVIIRDAPRGPNRRAAPDRIVQKGSDRLIYRPQPRAPDNPSSVFGQRIDERHPGVRPNIPNTPRAPGVRPPSTRPARPSAPPGSRRSPGPSAPPSPPQHRGEIGPPSPLIRLPPSRPGRVYLPPAPPPTRGIAPLQTPPAPVESPRGREQRLSSGPPMQRLGGAPSARVPSAPQPGGPGPNKREEERRRR